MAVTNIPRDDQHPVKWLGLSTDTKPSPAWSLNVVRSEFWETDTGDIYIWNGAGWVLTTEETKVNKFGRAPSGVQTTATDIWDRADATPTQSVWLAPTAARIHTIQSTSASDVAGGTGATTVEVSYLADWDTKEAVETVSGNLNAGIAMSNAAVMIHRMKVVPQASSTTTNTGTITATAATDATVTAQINIGVGQTQMAIYGIPSTQKLHVKNFYASINKSYGTLGTINFSLKVNTNPDVQTLSFLTKNTRGLQSTGTSSGLFQFDPEYVVTGPAIIKIQGVASSNDIEASAGFNGFLENI